MIETQDQMIATWPSRRRRRQGLGLYQTRTGRGKLDCWIRGPIEGLDGGGRDGSPGPAGVLK
jgi:hypothetical protein